jgi:hypothetical protein
MRNETNKSNKVDELRNIERLDMKTFMKTSCVAALILAAATFGAPKAQAGGWPIAAGVVGGVAFGTAVGVTVASAQPVYYSPSYYAPAPVYAPAYVPAPVAVAAPYVYAPRVVVGAPYPYYYPYVRAGFGWGPRYYYGGRYYRR